MYFDALITIDPAQITNIQKVKPTGAFKRILFHLTAGKVSDEEEIETFSALSILQQINRTCRELEINNIIRLAKDDVDFYYDSQGEKNDFKTAIEQFDFAVDQVEAAIFNTLFLVIEHQKGSFRYLIQIKINRTHTIGKYPIEIQIIGLVNEFNLTGKKEENLQEQLHLLFENQGTYDDFVVKKESEFHQFLRDFEYALKKNIRVDDLQTSQKRKIVRPRKKIAKKEEINHSFLGDPIFYGYHGFDDALFYTLIWANFCYDRNIFCQNIHLTDDEGREILFVGESGFDAGEADTLNTEKNFSPPPSEELTLFGGHQFEEGFKEKKLTIFDPKKSSTEWSWK